MNYALDALWWRLDQPHVRALAGLLTAPPLWHSGCELPVSLLLGRHGFRTLLDWNDHGFRLPEPLPPRLGHYAEALLAYWFSHAPHSRLIAHNLPLGSPHSGAADFIAELSGTLYHIELCCKYYGSESGQPETMRGLNPADTLSNKRRKLAQQLALSQQPAARTALAQIGADGSALHRVSIVRGTGFSRSGSLPEHSIYPANAWSGIWADKTAAWQQFADDSRFYRLQRHEYLAPARVDAAQTVSRAEAAASPPALFAHVLPRYDGCWHETCRIMWQPDADSA